MLMHGRFAWNPRAVRGADAPSQTQFERNAVLLIMKPTRTLLIAVFFAFIGNGLAQIVPVTLIPSNSVWKYLDNGTDQGTAWRGISFDDSLWASGPAELGYGDDTETPPRPEATVLQYGPDAANKYTNYYFRRYFTVTNASSVSNLIIRLMRDDGAVVYINGAEVRRDNMP